MVLDDCIIPLILIMAFATKWQPEFFNIQSRPVIRMGVTLPGRVLQPFVE